MNSFRSSMASARFAMALAASAVIERRRIDPASVFRNSERHRIGTIQSASFVQAARQPPSAATPCSGNRRYLCRRKSHLRPSFTIDLRIPPIDLSCSDRAATAGRALYCGDYFPVQVPMMFLCAFLYFPVQICRNVLQSNRRQNGTVTVSFLVVDAPRKLRLVR